MTSRAWKLLGVLAVEVFVLFCFFPGKIILLALVAFFSSVAIYGLYICGGILLDFIRNEVKGRSAVRAGIGNIAMWATIAVGALYFTAHCIIPMLKG